MKESIFMFAIPVFACLLHKLCEEAVYGHHIQNDMTTSWVLKYTRDVSLLLNQ